MKKYKILGDSFKQYIELSKNTFAETKTNKITEKNIDEIINAFRERKVETFVYIGHKENDEREAIGKIIYLEKDEEDVGIYAYIEWIDNSFANKESFYPSIEMVGKKKYEDNDFIYWENCEIKALALVEYPASKSVDLVCASAVINENNINNTKGDYMQKVKEILERLDNGEDDAKEELIYLLKNDEELQNTIINFLLKILKKENKDNKENKNHEDQKDQKDQSKEYNDNNSEKRNLSAVTYGDWCNEYAESQNAIRCSSKSESTTFFKAKKLFKAGLNKEEIMSIVRNDLVPIGIGTSEKINLSALKKETEYKEIEGYLNNLFKLMVYKKYWVYPI